MWGGSQEYSILFGPAAGWRVLTSLHSGHQGGPLVGPGGSQAYLDDGPRGDPAHLCVGAGEERQYNLDPVRYTVLPTHKGSRDTRSVYQVEAETWL